MTDKTPTEDRFEFLSPLDGKTYTLPRYNKELFFDASEGHVDEIPVIPPAAEFYSKKHTPASRRTLIREQGQVFMEFQLTSMIETFDAHLPDADDPAKAAIIALVNAVEWAPLFKIFNEWAAASNEEVVDGMGEG